MSLGDRIRRLGHDLTKPHADGLAELQVGDPRFDDWETVRDFGDLETARAWRQQLTDLGHQAVLTSDWPLDEHGQGDISLCVPPGKWSEANEALDFD